MTTYPKRLIEVDLPIHRISEHARAEKNLRSGHPWHLHIWWARRPWGACRAVALASLLPAPTDPACPHEFCTAAINALRLLGLNLREPTREELQSKLLWFVGEYACWELGANSTWRDVAKALVSAAFPSRPPRTLDPFSGYGAIPGEAARLGCDSVASDLNPVALLCLRTLLEAAPRHGEALLHQFEKGIDFLKKRANDRLGKYYPSRDGRQVIAWLCARTVTCEGPGCGAEIPLISQTLIAKGKRKTWIEITGNQENKEVEIHIRSGTAAPRNLIKTAGGGHATCPVCGFTTNKSRVKAQGMDGKIGNRLYGVAIALGARQGKTYAEATEIDHAAFKHAESALEAIVATDPSKNIPELFPLTYGLHVPPHYGIKTWGDLFSPRQKLAMHTLGEIIREYHEQMLQEGVDTILARDAVTVLALSISNTVHYSTTMSTWLSECMISCFITGNAIAMRWDWAEANPLVDEYVGGIDYAMGKALDGISAMSAVRSSATVFPADATKHPLPDDAADLFFTDPPYYDVVPYADLSDLNYVWLKRFVGYLHPDLLSSELTPKEEQIVVNPYAVEDGRGDQSPERYQKLLTAAFAEGRRILRPDGIGCIVFAHKGTAAWEALLAAILDAGFMVTASWPIDTERAARMRAMGSAALGSSIHIVIRPREDPDGAIRTNQVGDWREVLSELPQRIHDWMPRLAAEGVVGADAIFACLGPALEIFSRYSRVEKASGEQVSLRDYLEQVWAAVSQEALHLVFEDADASGFEEDARLTAMWLWTLSTGNGQDAYSSDDDVDDDTDNVNGSRKKKASGGYALEYDTARKIAQGLGAHLENLGTLVEVKGETARLLPVAERTKALFGKDQADAPVGRKKQSNQMLLPFFQELEQAESDWGEKDAPKVGETTLDCVHQAMILFAAGRSEAMRRFLVEEGVGRNSRFWTLAQSLSALYPVASDEKRWVDGVLARKKGLGF